jgi:hypothetical protein
MICPPFPNEGTLLVAHLVELHPRKRSEKLLHKPFRVTAREADFDRLSGGRQTWSRSEKVGRYRVLQTLGGLGTESIC